MNRIKISSRRPLIGSIVLASSVLATASANPTQFAYSSGTLTPSSSTTGDKFGSSIAVDGDILAVGARAYSVQEPTAGSVTIFERQTDGSWSEVATLLPPAPEVASHFGEFVAVSGEIVVVTEQRDSTFGNDEGSVFIYQRQSSGVWSLIQNLGPSDPDNNVLYGSDIATDGDRLAVMSPGWFDQADGYVQVFVQQVDGTYALEGEIQPPVGAYQGHFGFTLAMEDDWLVIGAQQYWSIVDDGSGVVLVPLALVYRRGPSGSWLLVAELNPPAGSEFDGLFGSSVDLEVMGDSALVAVGAKEAQGIGAQGAVDLFSVAGDGTWEHLDRVFGGPTFLNDWLGHQVQLDGERLYAAAPILKESFLLDTGRVFVFDRAAHDDWQLQVELDNGPIAVAGDPQLGWSMTLDGSRLLVGAPGQGGFSTGDSGVVHIYDDVSLFHGVTDISVAAGGTQGLFMAAGPAKAGHIHLLLGSVTGTSPGFPLPSGFVLPLVPDAYSFLTLSGGGGVLVGGIGLLGPLGEATASFILPAGSDPSLAGLTVFHAYETYDASLQLSGVSGAVAVTLTL